MHRKLTMRVENKICYPIIKATVLNNIVHLEDRGLNLWRGTNLCLDIQMQVIRINISTLYEVSWGHADKAAFGDSPVQSHSHRSERTLNDNKTSPVLMVILPSLTCRVFGCSCSKCYRMRRRGWSQCPQEGQREMPARGEWGSSRHTEVAGSLCQASARIWWHWAPPVKLLLAWQDVHSLGRAKEHCKALAFVFRLRKCFKIDQWAIK